MAEAPNAPAVELLDSRQDHRWVWTAMEPAERRQLLDRMARWMDWLVGEYPNLHERVPGCWYQHSAERNELTALYVAWVRIFVEPGENQREMALVEWHDALDRVMKRVTFPVECLENGEHKQPVLQQREPWRTEPMYPAWAGTDPAMTSAPYHPAPFYAPRPKPQPGAPVAVGTPTRPVRAATPAPAPAPEPEPEVEPRAPAAALASLVPTSLPAVGLDRLVADGVAQRFASGAVRHCQAWWINPTGQTYIRLMPDNPQHLPIIEDLDAKAPASV